MALGYFRKQNGVSVYSPFTYSVSSAGLTNSLSKIGTVKLCGTDFNYFNPYDLFTIETRGIKSNTSATASVFIKIGPNQSSTDQTIGFFTSTSTTQTVFPLMRTVRISGTQSYAFGTTSSLISDYNAAFNSVQSVLNLDFTNISNSYYITIWSQLNSSSNTMSCSFISVKHINGASQSL
jgi:hypothetical protein